MYTLSSSSKTDAFSLEYFYNERSNNCVLLWIASSVIYKYSWKWTVYFETIYVNILKTFIFTTYFTIRKVWQLWLKTSSLMLHEDWPIEQNNWASNFGTQHFFHHPFLFQIKDGFGNAQFHFPILSIFMIFSYPGYGGDPYDPYNPADTITIQRIPQSRDPLFPPWVTQFLIKTFFICVKLLLTFIETTARLAWWNANDL